VVLEHVRNEVAAQLPQHKVNCGFTTDDIVHLETSCEP